MRKQHVILFGILLHFTIPIDNAEAARATPDTPFAQEYRDPFVKGETAEENDVRAVAVDSDSRIWAATAAGIRVVRSGQLFEPPGAAVNGPAYDIAIADDGTIWVGAWNGVYRIDRGTATRVGQLDQAITAIALHKGRVTVGSSQGIHTWTDGKWQPVSGDWFTPILDLVIDDDRLYAASWAGLSWKSGEQIEHLSQYGQLRSRNVSAVTVGPNGDVWIGSRGGIDVFHKGKPKASYTPKDGLPSTDVRSLAFDSAGRLWVGTGIGMARFDGKNWSLRHSLRWLPDDNVRDVAFEKDGSAWIATRDGISVIRTRQMTLADKADVYEKIVRARHVRPPGLIERCRFREPGDLSTFEPMDTDNDGMYTGLYLVAEACRYAVTQAADAKANAIEAFRGMEFLQTVTDTPGFMARTVVPSSWTQVADRNQSYTPQQAADEKSRDARWKRVEQRWRRSADGKWLWKGDTSSDEITGHFFAYGFYYDLVADDEEKKRVARLVRGLMDSIIDGGYVLRDLDGEATRWAVWSPEKLNDDPNWRRERGCNSVEILSYLTITHHMTGDEKYEREISKLLNEHHYDRNILAPMDAGADHFTYIGFQLLAMSYPALFAYEKDPQRLALYRKSAENWFAPVRKDASPLYGFVFASGCDGDFLQDECVELLRDVPLDMVQWSVDNAMREDVNIVERPVEGEPQLDRLVPPSERAVFRWDRNVYAVSKLHGGRVESSTAFWLAPYWMGRYYGLIGAPQRK